MCTGRIDNVAVEILRPFSQVIIASAFEEGVLLPLLDGAIGLVVRGVEGSVSTRVIDAGTD